MSPEIVIPENESLLLSERLESLRKQIGEIPMTFGHSIQPGPRYFSSKRFDINRFLEVFDRIKLNQGYVLDYFYHADDLGGYPIPLLGEKIAIQSSCFRD